MNGTTGQEPASPLRSARLSSAWAPAGRLGLLAAALSAVIALETMAPAPPDIAVEPKAPLAARQADAPTGASAAELEESVRPILARPIFAPSRRPIPVAAAAAILAPDTADLPRLSGVIITAASRFALFAPVQGKTVAVAPGGSIENYMIRSIGLNEVILSGPAGERALRPSFGRIIPHVIHAQQEAAALN